MTPIELSIKRKIEAVGTPLKDWDINIYRGILTGYNDAFIISTSKREEILSNCQNDDERKRTDELIRPILRGRDIKRYGYEWTNLYLIATFPARHYDINMFPAIKSYLLSFAYDTLMENGNEWVAKNYLAEFCKQKLEQTGQDIVINGKYVLDQQGHKEKSRKRTSNKWFETQDSISYWEDFFKPKIMYPNMTKFIPFYYDLRGFFQNDKSFMVTGHHIAYLTAFFNSSLFKFCFLNNFPELQGGTRELRKVFFDKIPVKDVSDERDNQYACLIEKMQKQPDKNLAKEIDCLLFEDYELTREEQSIIGFVEIV